MEEKYLLPGNFDLGIISSINIENMCSDGGIKWSAEIL